MRTQSFGVVLVTLALGKALACLGQAADPDKQQASLTPAQVLDHGGLFRPASLGGRDLILLSLAFSPDGKTIASAGGGTEDRPEDPAKGEVKLWDVATGKALKTIAVEKHIVFHATFSPDGKLLATASGSGTAVPVVPGEIRLWNPATGELIRTLQGHHRGAYVAAFSPDGKLLASGGIATIDASKKVEVRGANATGEIKLWDLQTGQELWTRGGHTGAVGSLAFSADGTTLASGGGLFDGKVKVWDVATGTDLFTLEFETEVVSPVAFGPKAGNLFILGQNPTGKEPFTVRVSQWDIIERQQVQSVDIQNGNAYRMTLLHSGNLLACACHDGVKVYDVAKQVQVRSLPSKFRMRPVAFSPDGGLLAAGSDDGTVKLWSVAKLRK